ncbi:TlpA family protein disulfide reductase [Candidatus Micrarchaeota archaeon]|nr:TlpA family protein disulfide reductase [Candidatus Micrarchaeota archaeon]
MVNNASQEVGTNFGDQAPGFSVQDPEKGPISKSTFLGKPLFIFFTTTYCVPCQIGAQNLAKYQDDTGGNAFKVLIVFVDQSEPDNKFIAWRNAYGRSNWYVAKDSGMVQTYKVQYLDTKYILDKNGTIEWFSVAPLTYESIKPAMDPLLK